MATLDSSDANIVDAESTNWQAIVYPILAVLVLFVGGFSYYYYQQAHRNEIEARANAALDKAKTPEEMAKVADDFPNTDTGTRALITAANISFDKKNYDAAIGYYERAGNNSDTTLSGSARVGLASAQEGAGKLDDAINTYLVEAHLGKSSPYAPYAYSSAARLYEQKGDKDDQLKTLSDLASGGFDTNSSFVQEAQAKLKALSAPAPTTISVPAGAPAPAATPMPTPPPAAPVKK